ncbi:hypothetical protein [Nonomuraea typhae]|uniref:hypothetical protein n=1 Tax=Nonomuraea typhae TaxID=2603600 RepID=UPI0012F9209B|nr:hypothetical protein [Nonomuraea typhae]
MDGRGLRVRVGFGVGLGVRIFTLGFFGRGVVGDTVGVGLGDDVVSPARAGVGVADSAARTALSVEVGSDAGVELVAAEQPVTRASASTARGRERIVAPFGDWCGWRPEE